MPKQKILGRKNIIPKTSDSSRNETFYILVAAMDLHKTKPCQNFFFFINCFYYCVITMKFM